VTAAAVKGVRLDAWQWVSLAAAMWLGSLPFALMGVAVGFTVGPDAAFPLSYGLYMAMSALGGLWVPPAQLTASLRQVAHALPTYRLADLGWQVAAGHPPTAADAAVLAAWSAGFALLAVAGYRGPRSARPARAASLPAA
jgi:ABC-2 type transport system permease protein